MTSTLLLFIFSCIYCMVLCKIPKKFKSKDDKSLYCNVCENIMIDVEEEVMKNVEELSGSVKGYKMDSKGKRKRKSFTYEFDEDDVLNAIDSVCSSWGSNLGTSKQNNGDVVMLKSTNLQGSFSGSLNFGGEASTKVLDICRSNVKKQRKNIIKVVTTNDLEQLKTFCKDYVYKKCKKIKYPKKLVKQIKDLGERGIGSDDDDDDDEIQLTDDKEDL
eukprot:361315_1